MLNKALFLLVVIIWSTTPLAMKWSNESLSFIAAVSLRMAIGVALSFVLIQLMRKSFPMHRRAWLSYAVGAMGMYPAMTLVYLSVQYIPSGLVSVIYGLTPFIVGVFSTLILKEKFFTPVKMSTLSMAFIGLVIVYSGQIEIDSKVADGFPALLLSIIFFCLSTVLIKKVNTDIPPLSQSAGSMLLSMPFFIFTWAFMGFDDLSLVTMKSWSAVAYLAVIGSIVGFVAFFYLLKQLTASTVSLISLLSPILALILGHLLESEIVSNTVLIGSALILASLALSQQEKRIVIFLKK